MVTLCFKEWLYSEQLEGEWWIMSGQAMSADDYGDYNHEAYVIMTAQNQITDGDEEDWEEFKKELAKEIYDNAMTQAQTPQQQQQVQQQWDKDNGDSFLAQGLKEKGVSDELYMAAEGMGDTREIGMKLWGWKRVADTTVETWSLTKTDMTDIAQGLWDAYPEEDALDRAKIDVYVYSNQHWYNEVPMQVLEAGNISAMRQYESGRKAW